VGENSARSAGANWAPCSFASTRTSSGGAGVFLYFGEAAELGTSVSGGPFRNPWPDKYGNRLW
jgi:hypothetical protein